MAEQTGLRNNALPYPIYGAPFGVVFPILDADGDPVTGASSPDSEVSKNGDTFGDCSNEAVEIATASGLYYLLLTATEMTADVVAVQVKNGTAGAKTTPITLYPRKLVTLRSGTAAGGAAGSITLDSGALAVDDIYNGCVVVATLDGAVEARVITDYVGSTKVASVTPNWNTTPDSDDTFIVYLPEGMQIPQANVAAYGGVAGTFSSGRPEVNTTHWGGTVVASANVLIDGAITAAKIATDAIQAAKIQDNALTAAKFATGAFDAVWTVTTRELTAFSASFKTGYALSSAGVQAIWDFATASIVAAGSIGKLLVDNVTDSIATITARLTSARAGYLDNLNVGGNVASSAEVVSIQNNTRVVRVVPEVIERPDSGTVTYRIELLLYDAVGNMEAPDSAPTIALENQAGTDRSSRLDSTTMALVSTGRYRAIYTADVADTLEQLVWTFSVVEGGATRLYGNQSVIVDTTAVDFTAADRAKLDTLHDTRLTAQRATNLDNLDATVSSRLATSGYTAPDNATITALAARLGAFTGTGVNTVLGFFRALFRKDLAAPSDVGGAFDPATDSTEGIRDNMGTPQTGDSFARIGLAGAGLTALGDTRIANLDATVSSRATPAQVNTEADQALADAGVTTTRTAKLDGLPEGIKKNQALAAFEFFMVDESDHVTGKTGLTVTAQRSIDGGAFAACANSPTEVASGFYTIDLEAADLNGTVISFRFSATGADDTALTLKTSA